MLLLSLLFQELLAEVPLRTFKAIRRGSVLWQREREQFTCLCSNTMTRHCFAYYYISKTEPVSYVRQGP